LWLFPRVLCKKCSNDTCLSVILHVSSPKLLNWFRRNLQYARSTVEIVEWLLFRSVSFKFTWSSNITLDLSMLVFWVVIPCGWNWRWGQYVPPKRLVCSYKFTEDHYRHIHRSENSYSINLSIFNYLSISIALGDKHSSYSIKHTFNNTNIFDCLCGYFTIVYQLLKLG
jgi:hypothetical protein